MKKTILTVSIAMALLTLTSCKTVEEQRPTPVDTKEAAPKKQSDALHDFKPATIKL